MDFIYDGELVSWLHSNGEGRWCLDGPAVWRIKYRRTYKTMNEFEKSFLSSPSNYQLFRFDFGAYVSLSRDGWKQVRLSDLNHRVEELNTSLNAFALPIGAWEVILLADLAEAELKEVDPAQMLSVVVHGVIQIGVWRQVTEKQMEERLQWLATRPALHTSVPRLAPAGPLYTELEADRDILAHMSGCDRVVSSCTDLALVADVVAKSPLEMQADFALKGADAFLKRFTVPDAVKILESEVTPTKDSLVKLNGQVHANGSENLRERVDLYSDGFIYTKDFLKFFHRLDKCKSKQKVDSTIMEEENVAAGQKIFAFLKSVSISPAATVAIVYHRMLFLQAVAQAKPLSNCVEAMMSSEAVHFDSMICELQSLRKAKEAGEHRNLDIQSPAAFLRLVLYNCIKDEWAGITAEAMENEYTDLVEQWAVELRHCVQTLKSSLAFQEQAEYKQVVHELESFETRVGSGSVAWSGETAKLKQAQTIFEDSRVSILKAALEKTPFGKLIKAQEEEHLRLAQTSDEADARFADAQASVVDKNCPLPGLVECKGPATDAAAEPPTIKAITNANSVLHRNIPVVDTLEDALFAGKDAIDNFSPTKLVDKRAGLTEWVTSVLRGAMVTDLLLNINMYTTLQTDNILAMLGLKEADSVITSAVLEPWSSGEKEALEDLRDRAQRVAWMEETRFMTWCSQMEVFLQHAAPSLGCPGLASSGFEAKMKQQHKLRQGMAKFIEKMCALSNVGFQSLQGTGVDIVLEWVRQRNVGNPAESVMERLLDLQQERIEFSNTCRTSAALAPIAGTGIMAVFPAEPTPVNPTATLLVDVGLVQPFFAKMVDLPLAQRALQKLRDCERYVLDAFWYKARVSVVKTETPPTQSALEIMSFMELLTVLVDRQQPRSRELLQEAQSVWKDDGENGRFSVLEFLGLAEKLANGKCTVLDDSVTFYASLGGMLKGHESDVAGEEVEAKEWSAVAIIAACRGYSKISMCAGALVMLAELVETKTAILDNGFLAKRVSHAIDTIVEVSRLNFSETVARTEADLKLQVPLSILEEWCKRIRNNIFTIIFAPINMALDKLLSDASAMEPPHIDHTVNENEYLTESFKRTILDRQDADKWGPAVVRLLGRRESIIEFAKKYLGLDPLKHDETALQKASQIDKKLEPMQALSAAVQAGKIIQKFGPSAKEEQTKAAIGVLAIPGFKVPSPMMTELKVIAARGYATAVPETKEPATKKRRLSRKVR